MKRLFLVLALTITVLAFSVVKIAMVYWPGPESEAMQKVVDYWNSGRGKQLGIEVEIVNFSREGFWEKQETLLNARSSSVDIVFVATYIMGRLAPHLVPLEGFDLKPEVFIASALESMSYEGFLYGLPLDVSNHFLYYRKDLLDRLLNDSVWRTRYEDLSQRYLGKKLSPKTPEEWTWEDYKAMAIFFTKKYNPDSPTAYGNVLQMKNLVYNIMIWNDVLWSMGGRWFDAEGKFSINTEPAKKAASLFKELYDMGTVPPGVTTYEFGEANEAFKSGNVFMMMQWSAAYNILTDRTQSPLIYDKVGIAPIPGPRPSTHIHCLGVALSKYSKKKDAAIKFLSFLATEEAMKMYAENGGIPPVETILKAMGDKRPEFPIIADHVKKYGYVESTLAQTMAILEIMSNKLTAYWTGQIQLEAALQEIQKECEALLR
ncbi:MAG: Extracellular solute-binding protein family 1 [Thermotoga sp. 50_1627]|uniref:ABC transporter substrate-binding protein n=1 Tax=Pseudothermotoga sp. TaxID=2033661 RepID=UPI00076D2F5F|nr:MAG: Extracellular solute-binding protein family 1 [Thermotoga sp. 50_64]KUK24604.1 MAG: Extracellular solute-binding protein family 1 [Thermotoga sp. 50_1627]MBC7117141.1 sugar ABC transporter substrate-binding protein [Pseudothermotoga sp.]